MRKYDTFVVAFPDDKSRQNGKRVLFMLLLACYFVISQTLFPAQRPVRHPRCIQIGVVAAMLVHAGAIWHLLDELQRYTWSSVAHQQHSSGQKTTAAPIDNVGTRCYGPAFGFQDRGVRTNPLPLVCISAFRGFDENQVQQSGRREGSARDETIRQQ
jgi:hypothetical protein